MAGTYRSSGNNLSNKLGRLATSRVKEKVSKAKTDYYVEKRKEIEHTKGKIQKSVYSHKEGEKRKTMELKAKLSPKKVTKTKPTVSQPAKQPSKPMNKPKQQQPKRSNDMLYGKKIKPYNPRKKLGRGRKW